jgi:hypothetical protein
VLNIYFEELQIAFFVPRDLEAFVLVLAEAPLLKIEYIKFLYF